MRARSVCVYIFRYVSVGVGFFNCLTDGSLAF